MKKQKPNSSSGAQSTCGKLHGLNLVEALRKEAGDIRDEDRGNLVMQAAREIEGLLTEIRELRIADSNVTRRIGVNLPMTCNSSKQT